MQCPYITKTVRKINNILTPVDFPCKQCAACLAKYKTEQINRNYVEEKYSVNSCFATFKPEDKHFQYTEKIDPETGEIKVLQSLTYQRHKETIDKIISQNIYNHKNHPQNWTQKDYPFKFYGIMEYGTKSQRQHAHYLLYNLHPKTKENLQKNYGYGHVHIANVETGSIAYVVNHQLMEHKKGMDESQKPLHFKSNNIGIQYVEIHKASHANGRRWFLNQETGKPTAQRKKANRAKSAIPKTIEKKLDALTFPKDQQFLDNLEQIKDHRKQTKFKKHYSIRKELSKARTEKRTNKSEAEHFEKYGKTKYESFLLKKEQNEYRYKKMREGKFQH